MKLSTSFLLSWPWKKRSVMGTAPRAPWIVARGIVDMKQKRASMHVSLLGWNSQPRAFRVMNVTKKTETPRTGSPHAKQGRASTNLGKISGVVRLPSMLKSTSCPKTQTPPMMPSTSWRVSWSATAAKKEPVTITSSSGWNAEPGLKRIGTTSWPGRPQPRPCATRAQPRTMRKASAEEPVKTWRPIRCSCVLRGTSQPAVEPSTAPMAMVAKMRRTLAAARSDMFTSGMLAGWDRPTRIPNSVRTKEASSGAHVNMSLGMGWPTKRTPSSFIFGITRPSPIATSTVPRQRPSIRE
mmetsp:Transcript_85592/g.220351  ORF Transcript_85592/g.220351 Transcript_85592/m.220351 type:complete len:296 (+) Transcript_85592:872-1759(+)